MHHEENGKGIPLLLIHGFPHDHTLWEPQLAGLSDVARVIAPDLRGFGLNPDVPDTMTMEDHARDLKDLLDRLGIERAVIGGLSMGGYIALAFAELFPQALLGLMLCNTRSAADGEQAREGREATARKALDEGVAVIAEGMLPKMISPKSAQTHPDLSMFVENMMARQHAEGVAASARGMALRPDRTAILTNVKAPTLVITGSADTLIPPSESEAMAEKIPGSELVVIPDVAHLSNLEDVEAFNAAVRKFLGRMA